MCHPHSSQRSLCLSDSHWHTSVRLSQDQTTLPRSALMQATHFKIESFLFIISATVMLINLNENWSFSQNRDQKAWFLPWTGNPTFHCKKPPQSNSLSLVSPGADCAHHSVSDPQTLNNLYRKLKFKLTEKNLLQWMQLSNIPLKTPRRVERAG